MLKKIIVLIVFLLVNSELVNAKSDENKILDKKINKFCDLYWKWYTKAEIKKCKWSAKAVYRFETWNLKSYVWQNIFNFRSPTIKKERSEKYGVIDIRWWFLVFKDKTNSIKFYVQRFYKYDRRKTVTQIVSWWCYYNLKKRYVCFKWYTHTWSQEEHNNYIHFINKFIKNEI